MNIFRARSRSRGLIWVMFGLLFSVIIIIANAGCSRKTALVPVTGVVTWKGQPVMPGAVFFEPEAGSSRASSLLQTDGSFVLRTYPAGNGALPGSYTVYVQLGAGAKPELARYTAVETSPLKVSVPEQGPQDFHFELSEESVLRQ